MNGPTTGPWARHDTPDYAEIHPASGKLKSAIALVGKPEDANLIAAAPDMLAALKMVHRGMMQWAIMDHAPEWKVISEAIAKAEGRT
ncbi:hypothetical protein U0C82_03925 [Fulvimarina sp. 2208YS6-2-32]|uniref:Uncharacterized protein n=1 Tax=Fulvimarina uroteuthidis TaxID=3098149 RepID=A0ABU5HYU4_9HYPH|nr:hypothetical protein [Fulvimarina sp. 2208YS6-2-32]MDY8108298.1 hypothetical protein [Fulvimarina sp. 2208YS6-2-32]